MENRRTRSVAAQALAGRVADNIADPVRRLKFLRATAPALVSPATRRRTGRMLLWFLIAALLSVCAAILLRALPIAGRPVSKHSQLEPPAIVLSEPYPTPAPSSQIWLVEKTPGSESWSNGLRIDNRFLVSTHKRAWLTFPADGGHSQPRETVAGIVFHATESQQAPFEPSENRKLRRLGESLLEYIQRQKAYNFVIDRFGRVYRVVAETETANHSGYSAWADENWRYINLNESFIGIAFEASAQIDPAQTRSAAMLVEMLRHRYNIPAANCVTHAQVSVNPRNMRVGYHLDWAAGLPFEAMGLPDNYAVALPALWAYGFDYDPDYSNRAGAGLQIGMARAQTLLDRSAAKAGLTAVAYRKLLRQHYREMLAEVAR